MREVPAFPYLLALGAGDGPIRPEESREFAESFECMLRGAAASCGIYALDDHYRLPEGVWEWHSVAIMMLEAAERDAKVFKKIKEGVWQRNMQPVQGRAQAVAQAVSECYANCSGGQQLYRTRVCERVFAKHLYLTYLGGEYSIRGFLALAEALGFLTHTSTRDEQWFPTSKA